MYNFRMLIPSSSPCPVMQEKGELYYELISPKTQDYIFKKKHTAKSLETAFKLWIGAWKEGSNETEILL